MIDDFKGARSVCKCGHTGGGPGSEHATRYAAGFGKCQRLGCSCAQFEWASFTKEFTQYLESKAMAREQKRA
jgi:hypothetical protein